MSRTHIRVGFEIEGEYTTNTPLDSCDIGGYHCGHDFGLKWWTAEEDGSLRANGENIAAEIVSRKIPLSRVMDALGEYVYFFSRGGNIELSDAVIFNGSTGAHIHFSVVGCPGFMRLCPRSADIALLRIFSRRLAKSPLPDKVRRSIMAAYFRSYAERWPRHSGRYASLNTAAKNGRTIEWRSFNLRGVETWEHFYIAYGVAIETIKEFIRLSLSGRLSYDITAEHDRIRATEPQKERTLRIFA